MLDGELDAIPLDIIAGNGHGAESNETENYSKAQIQNPKNGDKLSPFDSRPSPKVQLEVKSAAASTTPTAAPVGNVQFRKSATISGQFIKERNGGGIVRKGGPLDVIAKKSPNNPRDPPPLESVKCIPEKGRPVAPAQQMVSPQANEGAQMLAVPQPVKPRNQFQKPDAAVAENTRPLTSRGRSPPTVGGGTRDPGRKRLYESGMKTGKTASAGPMLGGAVPAARGTPKRRRM